MKLRAILTAALIAFATGLSPAVGADLYWDVNGDTPDGSNDGLGTGTWGVDNFWTTDSTGSSPTGGWVADGTAVFSAGTSVTGTFDVTLSGTQSAGGVVFQDGMVTITGGTELTFTGAGNVSVGVRDGDYNGDGVVDAADYVVWRKDPNSFGGDPAGYNVWRANFGAITGPATMATINSVIGGAVGLNKTGTGTLVLGGANTYTGNTAMATNSGTLKLAATNTLPAATVLSLPPANGNARVELYDSGGTYYNQTIAGLVGGGIGTASPTVVDVGFAELTLDVPSGESYTYAGYLKTDFTDLTTRGRVIKNGPGEFILAGQNGTSPHRFSGEFVMNEGRLGFANNVVLGVNNDISSPATLRINGGTLFKAFANPATSMSMTPRTVDIGGSFTFDMSGTTANAQINPAAPLSGVGGINLLVDNPTITVTIPNTTSPTPTFILAGVIQDGGNTRGFTKAGNGTLTLNRVNTYSGPTTILEGVLRLAPINNSQPDGTLGDGTGVLNLSGGAIEYNGVPSTGSGGGDPDGVRSLTVVNPIDVTANSAIAYRTPVGSVSGHAGNIDFVFTSNSVTGTSGSLTLLNDGTSSDAGAIVFRPTFAGFGYGVDRPIVISNHATIANRTTVLRLANTLGTQTFSGIVSGNGGVLRDGAGGTTILSGNNTYTGDTSVLAGTLSITNPFLADGADVILSTTGGGAILDLSFTGTDAVDQLFIDGVAQAAGTYGFSAMNPSGLFTGTGVLVALNGPGSGTSLATPAVPEPGTTVFAVVVFGLWFGVFRRRRR